jgi:Asp-tRNA(Asn)/Glu-tRNA(Gln) amidotransferase A subunit family amidase
MANLASYPAISIPNGFLPSGSPSAVTSFARPFGKSELLLVAKAYQDATRHHLEHPRLWLLDARRSQMRVRRRPPPVAPRW